VRDNQQEHEMEQVARNFSEALIAAHRVSGRGDVAPRQADPELTRRFCNLVIRYLDARTADAYAASREKQLEQIRGAQEPTQLPEQESVESVGAYMGFLNSMLAYYMRTDTEVTG
jgi:hypothetical protein